MHVREHVGIYYLKEIDRRYYKCRVVPVSAVYVAVVQSLLCSDGSVILNVRIGRFYVYVAETLKVAVEVRIIVESCSESAKIQRKIQILFIVNMSESGKKN